MGAETEISWCDHTFNPWVGCTKVSAACDHCYAEGWAKRTGQSALWRGERRRTTETTWKSPVKWNEWAARDGVRRRVFCASLADVFDNQVPDLWRSDLFALIEDTPNLDWLLLTKRPQNIAKMIWPKWDMGLPSNIWLGTTTEDSDEYRRRWPHLAAIPAAIRFISYEPALGPLGALDQWGAGGPIPDWVICGGESGGHARPMDPNWARDARDECAAAGVAFHFKQWGGRTPKSGGHLLDGAEHRAFPARRIEAAKPARHAFVARPEGREPDGEAGAPTSSDSSPVVRGAVTR